MGIVGIGGLFFRAQDPKALGAWYTRHLGIINADGAPWDQAAGPTVVSPFRADTDYFPAGKSWMLNLRVDDMDAVLARLSTEGVAVITKPEWDSSDYGRFARIHDPEGNAIELWQPPA